MKSQTSNRLSLVVAFALTLFTGPAALAQGDRDVDGWVPVKHLEFTPDDVEGGLLGPDGELIESVQRAPQPSLIEIRAGFEAEVVKTMENM
jgi:hypothetical protein